jgi:hypothetical protein
MSNHKAAESWVNQFELQSSKIHLEEIGSALLEGLTLFACDKKLVDRFEKEFLESKSLDQILGLVSKSVKRLICLITDQFTIDKIKASDAKLNSQEMESTNRDEDPDSYSNLEKLLQKYESEIREHIRVQQELRLYSEDLLEKFEELSSRNKDYKRKINKLELSLQDSSFKLAKANEDNNNLTKRISKIEKRRPVSSFNLTKRAVNLSPEVVR